MFRSVSVPSRETALRRSSVAVEGWPVILAVDIEGRRHVDSKLSAIVSLSTQELGSQPARCVLGGGDPGGGDRVDFPDGQS
jgi:hypothetical protein